MLGDDWPTDPLRKQSFSADLTRQNISKYNLSYEEIQSSDFKVSDLDTASLLILNLPKEQLYSWIDSAAVQSLATTIVLRLTDPDLNVSEWINKRNIIHFIQDEAPQTFERIFELSNNRIYQRNITKQITDQHQSVDQVIQEQEEKIIAKTLDIELSNQEQNQKLKRERQLLKFLKDLALSDFYESFLRGIKNEFKVFHELGEIVLIEVKSKLEFAILDLKISDRWHEIKTNDLNTIDFSQSKNLSSFFANVFKRPFGKTVSVNLKGNYFLIIESHLNDPKNIAFQEFLSDRQDIIKMVFDKIDNEEKMNSFSYRWEKIFDFIKDPIAVIDENYNVIAHNRAFQRGFEKDKCFQIFAGGYQPCRGCPLAENINLKNTKSGNIIISDMSFDVMAYKMPNETSNGVGLRKFVHTYKDQTDSKKLQLELIQKKKMATIGKLAGHLSHELNNPLTGIRSMAQVLLQEQMPGTQVHKDLVEIESAAQRSLSVIRNFIDFSDNKNTRVESTDLHGLINRTIPLMKTSLRNHVVVKNLNAKNYTGEVNQPLFQQVLFNLIKNSIQAMDEKGRVLIETENPTDSTFKISISDSGKGIPKSVQSLIFQPFFTTKENLQGNGLGLSIVKSIVESFRGKINFTSEDGKGAQFNIELPIVSKDENTSH